MKAVWVWTREETERRNWKGERIEIKIERTYENWVLANNQGEWEKCTSLMRTTRKGKARWYWSSWKVLINAAWRRKKMITRSKGEA